jgi:hypothetical protein
LHFAEAAAVNGYGERLEFVQRMAQAGYGVRITGRLIWVWEQSDLAFDSHLLGGGTGYHCLVFRIPLALGHAIGHMHMLSLSLWYAEPRHSLGLWRELRRIGLSLIDIYVSIAGICMYETSTLPRMSRLLLFWRLCPRALRYRLSALPHVHRWEIDLERFRPGETWPPVGSSAGCSAYGRGLREGKSETAHRASTSPANR